MSVRVYADVGDIYHKLHRHYDAKLNYEFLLDEIEARFGEIDSAMAYVSQRDREANGFITCLQSINFTVQVKRPRVFKIGDREIKRCDWGVEISVDTIRNVEAGDTIILCVSNTDYIPLISYLRSFGAKVVIFASRVPNVMNKIADEVIEITDDLFEDEDDD